MKVLLTITTFTEDLDVIEYVAKDYVYQIGTLLKYSLLKSTTGKHIDAARPHYHTMVCYDISGAKHYKTLNEKINRLFGDLMYPSRKVADEFSKTEKKVTFIYEGEQKKHKKNIKLYDESSMCYVFKEYKKNHEIPYELQIGYTEQQVQEMREVANISWCEVLRKRAQHQSQELHKKEEAQTMTDYLHECMKDKSGDVNTLVRYIKHSIWRYKKLQYKKGTVSSVRVAAIKDQAISFLYFNDYITEEEIDDININ